MIIPVFVVVALVFFVLTMAAYRAFNAGLSRSSYHQQTTRYGLASLLAALPLAIGPCMPCLSALLLAFVISASWTMTYPLLYHLSNKKRSPDYDHKHDGAFALYVFGLLATLIIIGERVPEVQAVTAIVVALTEYVLLLVVLVQWVYYLMYHVCLDLDGMKILQETHINECIEYVHQMPIGYLLLSAVGIVGGLAGCLWVNLSTVPPFPPTGLQSQWQALAMLTVLAVVLLHLMFKRHHGSFWSTGIVVLFHDVMEYVHDNSLYASRQQRRLADLEVEALGKAQDKPGTIIMVIGESENRDFMSAFTPQRVDTTPWLSEMALDKDHFLLYPHAYSCAIQTVPALERALTEFNQFNNKPFYDSCSIVDIAHKLGYRVHWYSNQGHLGAADTPVTLVANTADVTRWTHQEVDKVQYDESLLDFLGELDPTKDNLLVIHLKGSHFNFLNRYPKAFTRWGEPGKQDNLLNYLNSICYTDSILQAVFDYGRSHLNLQAMVYFSDHATLPVAHRTPQFIDYGMTHIPLFIYLSDEYQRHHAERAEALKANTNRYWTNDMAYELMCGIFDIGSNHFDEAQSLASKTYCHSREELTTYEGRIKIADDPQGKEPK